MIKTGTREYKVKVCDACGDEEDLPRDYVMETCKLCGSDICHHCRVVVNFNLTESEAVSVYNCHRVIMCRSHLPPETFQDLEKRS